MRGVAEDLKLLAASVAWPTAAAEPIPFNRFCKTGAEFGYIQRAIDRMHISGDGEFTARCSEYLESRTGAGKALLTTSCTHALEMAALLLEIKPGDEVIVPSFTFVSTVNAFVLRGAVPVFIDIRPDTLNMDERLLAGKITPRTRAIVPVHYGGVSCEMDTIMRLAAAHGIPVVEDNAHGLFGAFRDRNLGTFGCMSTLSFHETKNITCGEGGALLINDRRLIERAEILRETVRVDRFPLDQPGVAERGCRSRLAAVDEQDGAALLLQMGCDADTDDAGPQNDNVKLHGRETLKVNDRHRQPAITLRPRRSPDRCSKASLLQRIAAAACGCT